LPRHTNHLLVEEAIHYRKALLGPKKSHGHEEDEPITRERPLSASKSDTAKRDGATTHPPQTGVLRPEKYFSSTTRKAHLPLKK
jgi:hypothetical protein